MKGRTRQVRTWQNRTRLETSGQDKTRLDGIRREMTG